jgi:alkylated DNA nucleotide flippase Atl1/3-methyladenine DNA glycosylase AlkD
MKRTPRAKSSGASDGTGGADRGDGAERTGSAERNHSAGRNDRTEIAGSSSYRRIYAVVARIPAGRVATYGQVAELAGLPGHARQVGYALHALTDDTDLPWQRVINSRGEVSARSTFFAAAREGHQRFLLEEEDVVFDLAGRVDLRLYRWRPGERRRAAAGGSSARAAAAKPATRTAPKTAPATGSPDDFEQEAERIAGLLRPLGSAARAAGAKAYLKSELEFFGVDTPALRGEAHVWLRDRPELDRRGLTATVAALWRRPVHELRAFAVELLMARHELLRAADLRQLEGMLRTARSWAYVDSLAILIVGPLVERHPKLVTTLDRWSTDSDFWLRRSALLALLRRLRTGDLGDPGSSGLGDPGASRPTDSGTPADPTGPADPGGPGDPGGWQRFMLYADAMLEEREFFVRKAIGWVLREVGKRHPRHVVRFLAPRLDRVAGLTLREAVKHLPAADRRRLLPKP